MITRSFFIANKEYQCAGTYGCEIHQAELYYFDGRLDYEPERYCVQCYLEHIAKISLLRDYEYPLGILHSLSDRKQRAFLYAISRKKRILESEMFVEEFLQGR